MKTIQHMVIFNLKYEKGSDEIKTFLNDGKRILSSIPVVQNFEVFHQVSPKNNFSYGFSMEFNTQKEYQIYNEHPFHVDFVKNRWEVEVTNFLEIDLTKYE